MNWIVENWLGLITAIAAIIAAITGAFGTFLQRQNTQRPKPYVEHSYATPVEGQPNWFNVTFVLCNTYNIPAVLEDIEVRRKFKLLSFTDATGGPGYDPVVLVPIPIKKATKLIKIGIPFNEKKRWSIFVHSSTPCLSTLRMRLICSWSDRRTKRYVIKTETSVTRQAAKVM